MLPVADVVPDWIRIEEGWVVEDGQEGAVVEGVEVHVEDVDEVGAGVVVDYYGAGCSGAGLA